jgi:hypothetical protein
MTTRPDAVRALDAVEPPDLWDEVERRASGPGALVGGDLDAPSSLRRRSGHRWLAAAAAILLMAGVVAALAVGRVGDPADERAGEGRRSTPTDDELSDGLFGHRWRLVRIEVGDGVIDQELVSDDLPIELDASEPGSLTYQLCNIVEAGLAKVVDGRLEIGTQYSTSAGCTDPLSSFVDLMDTSISFDGSQLVLRSSGAVPRTYRFERTDALAADAGIVGNRWRVADLVDATGRELLGPDGDGTIVDLRRPGWVGVEGCAATGRAGEVEGGRIRLDGSGWSSPYDACRPRTSAEAAGLVERILEDSPTVAIVGDRLVVESALGGFTARPSPQWDRAELFGDAVRLGTARWLVVEASDAAGPIDAAAQVVLRFDRTGDVGAPSETLSIEGCGERTIPFGGAAFELGPPEWEEASAPCSAELAGAVERLAALILSEPTYTVGSQRAEVEDEAGRFLLVRIPG